MARFRASERQNLDFGAGQSDLGFAKEVVQMNRGGFVSCRTRADFGVEHINRWGFASCHSLWSKSAKKSCRRQVWLISRASSEDGDSLFFLVLSIVTRGVDPASVRLCRRPRNAGQLCSSLRRPWLSGLDERECKRTCIGFCSTT
jgi:hypothetical protein